MYWQKVVVKIKRFQCCLKPNCPERVLYLRAIQGHSERANSGNAPIDPVLQDTVLLPMNFTKYVYRVGHGNELRSMVCDGLIYGGFSTKTGRYAVFFTVVDSIDDKRGLRKTFCELPQARSAPKKYLEASSKYSILVQFISRSRKKTAILPNNVSCSCTLWHTACRVPPESGMHENWRTALSRRKRKTFAVWITRSAQSRSKIILGNTKAKWEASGKPDATSWTTESQAYLTQRFKSRMNKNVKQSPSWSRSLNPISTRNTFFKIWARRRISTGSVKHRKDCWKTWIKQKSSSSAITLKSFSAGTANPLQKLGSFVADVDEI